MEYYIHDTCTSPVGGPSSPQPKTQEVTLLDLLGGGENAGTAPTTTTTTTLLPPTSTSGEGGGTLLDLLDLSMPQQQPTSQPPGLTVGGGDFTGGLLGLLDEGGGATQQNTVPGVYNIVYGCLNIPTEYMYGDEIQCAYHMYTHTHTHTHMNTHAHMHTRTHHAHMHMHTRTHACTHTHRYS